jgi:hypothetical protein
MARPTVSSSNPTDLAQNLQTKVLPSGGFLLGLTSPLYSLRFLLRNKTLLAMGLAPQAAGFAVFLFVAWEFALPLLSGWILGWVPSDWHSATLGGLIATAAFLLLVILYGLVAIPLISVLAGPIYDHLAAKAYESASGQSLGNQIIGHMVRSLVSEVGKLLVYWLILLSALLAPPLAPFSLTFSVWYLGWDIMDRTLAQAPGSLGQRFSFGLRHPLACLGLGVWAYIPFAGAALGFAFAAAGGIAAAHLGFAPTKGRAQSGPDQS